MIPTSPRALFRLTLWIVLLSLGGCGGSKPPPADVEKTIDAICAAAAVPVPDSASDELKQANAATRAACAARKVLAKDAG